MSRKTDPTPNRTASIARTVAFFLEHAGWSWNPKTETEQQGRHRCAQALTDAEAWALDQGIRYEWQEELCPDRSGVEHNGALWLCLAWLGGKVVGSLGGIDLGPEGEPWNVPYGRVVEAELALVAREEA